MASGGCSIRGMQPIAKSQYDLASVFNTRLRIAGDTCSGAIHMFTDVTTEVILDTLQKTKQKSINYNFSWNSYSKSSSA